MLSNISTKAYISVTEGLRHFKNDQKGVTAIEYGLIAIVIAVFIIAVFYGDNGFVAKLSSKFSELASAISSASFSTPAGK
ncbi:Flp family type IVb pilin [Lonepinella koalarum]|uniref:Pilus assembly protein Flp/PilA n=1 Tax=Lonepinella koalarum TaxID=53417 RepID=A0A4R1L166_9PAST|nr:Flp family type IVb pilin [Lonepinella koalarum]MDH2927806.1 fimbrial protein [Lonepinella koalarum]TCK69999.1 pilus assembly protein Flp/PilA [Lonepinella koalarum]TFJ90398.1 Flp family type IVb pilin [Lonepinella koalarum]